VSYTIRVWYHNEADEARCYTIEDTGTTYLAYDDLMMEPIMVRSIAKRGLVMGREKDGQVTRSGNYIPPHRITSIDWKDDYPE
jgi:uncharacterized protein (UPF0248 family)